MHRRTSGTARLAGALMLGSLLLAGFGSSVDAASRSIVRGTTPTWATSTALVGHASSTQVVGFRLYLGWRNAAAAEALARAVSDPKSASYRHYLSPAQFRSTFAPTAAQATAVHNWLKANGFVIVNTPANRHFIAAQGTVRQIETAFATTINVYRVSGMKLRAPARDLSVPTTIAPLISGAIGIDQSYEFIHSNTVVDKNAPPSAGFRNSPPLSTFWAEKVSPYAYPTGFTDLSSPATAPWTVKGYTPAQIKGAYGISGYDGAGQTVAIIDAYASPTILQDVNQWSTNRGLPTMTSGQFTQVVPPGIFRRPQNPRQDPQGWYGEETLDVEAVHGMAPAAKIVYVGAPNNYQDLDAALNHVVDRHLAQIVTNSYGWHGEFLPPGFIKPYNQTLVQAAIEGIGVYFSSGDSGDETSVLGVASADFPASSPWVTAVGGTSLGVSAANTRQLETGWGTSTYACNKTTLVCTRAAWLYGSGGGVSRVFAKPSYQASITATGRAVPDVAALGDPQTGLLIGQTQTFPDGAYYDEYRIGGTSLSSPIFAGLMALADQAAGSPHGFANPLFYAHAGAFYDVLSVKTAVARRNFVNSVDASQGTSDFLRTFDDYSGSPTQSTHAGWDNVTGLGTPTQDFLSTFGQ
ncbi:MAG TPA: S53 family peptidase [Candidatus Limnocylindrales bacterium]|nr:S53 family peptidase [Candidatus Limnocylindrales bacterium]